MKIPVIPWDEFFAALEQQEPARREIWLCQWRFSDDGVIPAISIAIKESSTPPILRQPICA